MQKFFFILIESFCIFLALFTPVAFGTVDLWAVSVMELVIYFAAFLWLSKGILNGKVIFIDTPLNIPILIFIILIILQYLFGKITSSKFGTIYPYATRRYFFEVLAYIFAFSLIVNNIHTRRRINRILFSIISIGTVLAIYGIVQKLAGPPKIFWFRNPREALLFYSSYFNCNYFAGYMNMMIFLTLGAFFAYLYYLDKKRTFYKFDIFEGWNNLFIFSITMMIISLFHTFSQGGIVVFILTSIFFYYIFLKRALIKKWILLIVLISTMALTIVALIWIKKGGVLDYFYEILNIFKEVNMYGARLPIWIRTLNLVKLNPLSGTGLGTFQYIFPRYRSKIPVYFLPHCHNDYLELLVETGFIGYLVFCFGMGLFFKSYVKLLRSRHDPYVKRIGYGCLASAFSIFIYSFLDSNMHIGANALLFSFILGLGSVVIHNRSNTDRSESLLFKTKTFIINNRYRKISLFLISSLVFFYLISNIVSICIADRYASIGKNEENIEHIETAVKLEPSSSEYHYLLADIIFKKHRLKIDIEKTTKKAIDELKESIRLNPNVSKYHQRLGWIYSYSGDKEEAIEELKIAQMLEPLNAFNYFLLAIYYFNEATKIEGINPYGSKAMEKGVEEYEKSLSIDPAINIDRYKNYLTDYPRIKKALERYSL